MTLLAQSPEIRLRQLSRRDLDDFVAYREDPEVARYQSWAKMTAEDALGFLEAMETEPLFQKGQWCQIGIADRENRLVGDIGLLLAAEGDHVELGITLARPSWGRGYAAQAMKLAFDLVWDQTSAGAIRCWGDQRNARSVALMRRVGMTHLGTEETDVVEEAFILHRPDPR